MNSLARPRIWIALSLGVVAALVAYNWPASPRATVTCDHRCWHLAFSRDSTKLAVLDRVPGLNPAGQILVLDAATGHVQKHIDIGQSTYPSKIIFAPDDQTVGILDAGIVTKWDPNTGRLIARYDHAEWSHDPDHYAGREILFAPTGSWLLHDVYQGRVYDVATGQIVNDYRERLPDRNLGVHGGCVAALVNNEVKTFDVLTGAEMGRFPTAHPRVPMARTAFTFSGDGTQGVYFGDTDQWIAHNAIDGHECRLGIGSGAMVDDWFLSADSHYAALSIWVPDSDTFGAWSRRLFNSPLSVRVFDTTSGAEVGQSIRGGYTACFAPNGRTLAVADSDKTLTIWDWPPPRRWPLTLVVAITTVLLSYGVSLVFGWRRRRSGRKLPSLVQCPEGAKHISPGQRPGSKTRETPSPERANHDSPGQCPGSPAHEAAKS